MSVSVGPFWSGDCSPRYYQLPAVIGCHSFPPRNRINSSSRTRCVHATPSLSLCGGYASIAMGCTHTNCTDYSQFTARKLSQPRIDTASCSSQPSQTPPPPSTPYHSLISLTSLLIPSHYHLSKMDIFLRSNIVPSIRPVPSPHATTRSHLPTPYHSHSRSHSNHIAAHRLLPAPFTAPLRPPRLAA